MCNTTVRIDYEQRMKAGEYQINVSQLTRDALRAQIEMIENKA